MCPIPVTVDPRKQHHSDDEDDDDDDTPPPRSRRIPRTTPYRSPSRPKPEPHHTTVVTNTTRRPKHRGVGGEAFQADLNPEPQHTTKGRVPTMGEGAGVGRRAPAEGGNGRAGIIFIIYIYIYTYTHTYTHTYTLIHI